MILQALRDSPSGSSKDLYTVCYQDLFRYKGQKLKLAPAQKGTLEFYNEKAELR